MIPNERLMVPNLKKKTQKPKNENKQTNKKPGEILCS